MDKLKQLFIDAFLSLGLNPNLALIVSSDLPKLSDYQCNGALASAKVLKQNPMTIAEKIVESLPTDVSIDYEINVVKPGFINIKLKQKKLLDLAAEALVISKEHKKVLIDYGSPNVAKGMHIGHLRSTLIGSALVSIHRYAGHEVVGDNHLGDWGTPLGIVITKIQSQQNFSWTLDEIESLYVSGSIQYKTDKTFKAVVLNTTNLLQQGDLGVKALWQKIVNITISSLKSDYEKLGVHFDLWEGESSFEHLLPIMIQELTAKGFVSLSDGALVIDLPGVPLMLEKSGGGYLYHTTDLACLKLRTPLYDKILYVVDNRQTLHFKQLFLAGTKVGYLNNNEQAEHVAFGTINGKDGKPFKTRDGSVLKIKELIEQVFNAAESKIKLNFTEEEKKHNLPIIAIGALKFAELKHQRLSDYVFDLDSFMALEGFTGPYVMYSAVRAISILSKTKIQGEPLSQIFSESERDLVSVLSKFKEYYNKSLNFNEPHHLCDFAFKMNPKSHIIFGLRIRLLSL
jgi:arginyl-tRNA synthetase